MALNTRTRGRIGALAAAALTFGGIVAAVPATALDVLSSNGLAWGFKESFRNYVGGRLNTEPVGKRIVPQAPAQFDGAGGAETRPYLFPVAAAAVTDAENLSIATAGGVTYNFPEHNFTISISEIEVVVEDGDARVEADLDIVVTEPFGEFEAGEHHASDVHVADVSDVDVTTAAGNVTVAGSGLTLTSEGAAFLPYEAGEALDDFTVSALTAPVVEISQSQFSLDGAARVTVTGRGFYHGNAIGTRRPLADQPAGAYVTVGYFAEHWRPSASAPLANRPAVSVADGGQKWAVPAESIPVPISPSLGGIELAADGSFTTELTVDKAVIDAAAEGTVTEGIYGIYTYPGSGADAPSFETYTPIQFVAVPVVAGAPKNAAVAAGSAAKFTAAVTGADALQWQSRTGNGSWTDIAGATAPTLEVATTSVAQSGTQYRVVATNSGGSVESAPATLTVTKAEATVAVAVKKKARFASKPKATVTVDAPEGVAATGAVVVKAGSKVVGKGTLRDGAATVTLTKKLRPGTRNLVAEYAGNADLTAATSNAAKVKVKKAAAKVKAKLAKKKVKVGKRGVLRVKVTAKGVKPSGKVKVTITKGKKKVRVVTLKAKGGKYAKVRLPKLAAGKYKIQVKYTGSKTVATKSAKKVTLRVR